MPAVWEPNPKGAEQDYGIVTLTAAGEAMEITASASDPEGVVTATVGMLHYNTATKTLWIKHSGTGNTGWIEALTIA